MKKKILLGTMLTLLFVSFLASTNITEANGTPRVYVNPAIISYWHAPGSSFSIDVILEDVADLYAWEFKLFWDNSILECVSDVVRVPEGVNWEAPNSFELGPGIEQDYSATEGRYYIALVAVPEVEPNPVVFEGTTILATLTFKVSAQGSCILDLRDTKLSNFDPVDILHEAEDGYFQSKVSTISVDPRLSNGDPGSTFSVDILLEDVADLYAWEFKLFWDNSILECVSDVVHIPGGVNWEDPNNFKLGAGIEQDYSATEGRYHMALVAIPEVEPNPVAFEGTTILATLTFNVLAQGGCILDLRDTKLSNFDAVGILHKAEDGNFQRPELAIEPSSRSTFTGTFSVDVTISNLDASVRLIGVDVKIRFNPAMLAAIGATEGPFMMDPAWAAGDPSTQFFGPYFDGDYVGFGILLVPGTGGEWTVFPEGEGTLATITFNATAAGSCALELFDTKLSDPDVAQIKHTTVDGSVTVMEGGSSPDVNGDGIVDVYDIVEAALAFGSDSENPRWNPVTDLNLDGIIDIYDLVLIAMNFGNQV